MKRKRALGNESVKYFDTEFDSYKIYEVSILEWKEYVKETLV